jgi:hypothetical protein
MAVNYIMHSAGSFLLRLPSLAVGDDQSATEWQNVVPGKMQGIFPESTWRMLNISKIYGPDMPHNMCAPPQSKYHDGAEDVMFRYNGSGVALLHALTEMRPRCWCVTIQSPEKKGSLAVIDWLHKRADELSYGGVVEPNGCWCLYVTGKCENPDKLDWSLPLVLDDAQVSEHLRIAVAEGTTMLAQMLIEQRW